MRFRPGDHVLYLHDLDPQGVVYTGVLLSQDGLKHRRCPYLKVRRHPPGVEDCRCWAMVLNTEGHIDKDVPECLMRLSVLGRIGRGEPFTDIVSVEDC